jgi:hypothetical protein
MKAAFDAALSLLMSSSATSTSAPAVLNSSFDKLASLFVSAALKNFSDCAHPL